MSLLRTIVATPLSWLYGMVVWVRNTLYSEHLLPSVTVDVPTICVGNLSAGGAGKTPHVEYLIRLLAPRYKVAVLSRGYKRTTHGFLMADTRATAATIGDEPMQIHRHFPDIPVAVCTNRIHGIHQLCRMVPDLQVVILDDAFQHRSLRCGFNMLLTPYHRLYVNDHMLPLGTLRDNVGQSLRAHVVVVTKCPDTMQPIDKRIVDNALHLPSFQQLFFSRLSYPDIDLPGTPLIVTGIADPLPLITHIQARWPQAELLAFPDHHAFSPRDVRRITEQAARFDCVLTTEKDYQRMLLTDLPQQLGERLIVLPVCVTVDDADQLNRQVLRYVSENVRHQLHNTNS